MAKKESDDDERETGAAETAEPRRRRRHGFWSDELFYRSMMMLGYWRMKMVEVVLHDGRNDGRGVGGALATRGF
ncbi:hypothetical protein Hanom_Chr04g00383951 [Helianthus anomalus]